MAQAAIPVSPDAHAPKAVPIEEEDEELEDVPQEEKKDDLLLHAFLIKNSCRGQVEDVERGTVSKDLLYRVRYEDGDLEHFTRQQVLDFRVEPSAQNPAVKDNTANAQALQGAPEDTHAEMAPTPATLKRPAAADDELEGAPVAKKPATAKETEVAKADAEDEAVEGEEVAGGEGEEEAAEEGEGEEKAEAEEAEEEEEEAQDSEPQEAEDTAISKKPAASKVVAHAAGKAKAKTEPVSKAKAKASAKAGAKAKAKGKAVLKKPAGR